MRKEICMDSQIVEGHIFRYLERLTKGRKNIFRETKLNSLGLKKEKSTKFKRWAERHFGFTFETDDFVSPMRTVGEFINLVMKYCEKMALLNEEAQS